MRRIVLILPSSTYRATDFTAAAAALGAEVVIACERRQALAGLMGARALRLPLADPEAAARAIVDHHATAPFEAVVAVDDAGVEAAALASARLGLRSNPPEAVRAARDKGLLRCRLDATAVAQPAHALVGRGADPTPAVDAVGLPCVLKPLALSASRGVIRLDRAADAGAVAARIRAIVADAGGPPDAPLMVERFVDGPEVAVEALLRDGRLEVLAVFDKPDPLDGPFFEETLYVTPSRHPAEQVAAVERLVADTAAGIGLREGPVHAEVRLSPAGPVLLELAARTIGGLCSRALRFGAGLSLEEVVLRHALGEPVERPRRELSASGVMMLPIRTSGRLEQVGGQGAARAVAGVDGLEITVPRGSVVRTLPEGDRYLGFLFARAATPDEVEQALREAHAHLDVRITPLPAAASTGVGAAAC
jgi:biotin carboxylase